MIFQYVPNGVDGLGALGVPAKGRKKATKDTGGGEVGFPKCGPGGKCGPGEFCSSGECVPNPGASFAAAAPAYGPRGGLFGLGAVRVPVQGGGFVTVPTAPPGMHAGGFWIYCSGGVGVKRCTERVAVTSVSGGGMRMKVIRTCGECSVQ